MLPAPVARWERVQIALAILQSVAWYHDCGAPDIGFWAILDSGRCHTVALESEGPGTRWVPWGSAPAA